MTAEAVFTRTWRVGHRTVTLTAPRPKPGAVASVVMEWEPNMPRRLTPDEMTAYRSGRDAALAELAVELGGPVAVIE